jgi:hypothetical protein
VGYQHLWLASASIYTVYRLEMQLSFCLSLFPTLLLAGELIFSFCHNIPSVSPPDSLVLPKGPSTLLVLVLQPIHTSSKYVDPHAPKPGEQLK